MLQKLIINFLCIFLFITQCSSRWFHSKKYHATSTVTPRIFDHNEIDDEHLIYPNDTELHSANFIKELDDENDQDDFCDWLRCDKHDKDLREPRGILKYVDFAFLKKLFRNFVPFSMPKMKMSFFLFRREFPDCGREIILDDQTVFTVDLDPKRPTRILIHGWMSQWRGSFNRDIKNAYLKQGDFNVIVVDWSSNAANLNYFSVVKMIEGFGAQLARFSKHLHDSLQVNYDDIYLIGHSLGAHIAGAAGKFIKPAQFNTIFALDPAGPKFRRRSQDFRIDPTDAKYVESIQTSALLGFIEPLGNATFYPNYGFRQINCHSVSCSHIRSYQLFAESLTTQVGFYGTPCNPSERFERECDEKSEKVFRMGGEPAVLKTGIFHVKTAASAPFALGKV